MNEVTSEKKTGALKRFFLLGRLGNGTKEEALILWFSIVPFCAYFFSGILIFAIAGAIVFDKGALRIAVKDKRFFALNAMLSGFSMLSSVIASNYIGMAISFCVFVILLIAGYLKETMTAAAFRKATVVISLGSAVSLIAALFQKLVIFPNDELYRPTAGAFNANYFGALVTMTSLMALVRLFDGETTEEKRKWYDRAKIYWCFILAVNLVSLLISESRSSLLSLTVCAVLFLFLKKRYLLCAAAVLCGGGIWLIGWLHPNVFSWTNSLSFIFTERTVIWKNAIRSFSQNAYTALIGRGPMTYYAVMEKEGLFPANHAHNILFDSLLNVGVVGTAIYAALAGFGCALCVKKFKRGETNGAVLAALIIAQIAVQGIADVTIMWHQCASLALILIVSKYKKGI